MQPVLCKSNCLAISERIDKLLATEPSISPTGLALVKRNYTIDEAFKSQRKEPLKNSDEVIYMSYDNTFDAVIAKMGIIDSLDGDMVTIDGERVSVDDIIAIVDRHDYAKGGDE